VYLHHLGINATFMPMNINMPNGNGFFWDFFDVYGYFNPYAGRFGIYPPLAYLIIYPFLKIQPPELSFIIYSLLVYGYIFWYLTFCIKSFRNKFASLEYYLTSTRHKGYVIC
jgi:hypothetical protein